jgi:hypothetical protein
VLISIESDSISGQPYAGRAISISGENFGYYDPQNSKVTIDGKGAPIVTWEETSVTVIVPAGTKAGNKEILIANPPVFDEKSYQKEFMEHKKTEVARAMLSPSEESYIEGKDFVFIAPRGSVAKEQEVVIYKYDSPSFDDNPYYTVTDEYEVTDSEGGHVFFDKPVYFGLNVADEEEALQSIYQIFDEYMGVWVKAETLYDRGDGKLYLVTEHFSGFRKFASVMYKGAKRMAGEAVDSGKKSIEYIYKKGKDAAGLAVNLAEEAYVLAKDLAVEEFVGVSDTDEKFIVYYRASDAAKDPSIPEKAKLMTAAFYTAYEEYNNLFGADQREKSIFEKYLDYRRDSSGPSSQLIEMNLTVVPGTIRVYIDPRYNKAGAKASIVTGNITMPSDYYGEDLASTCAHELFHVVQYHQLGAKQIYMANGLKDLADNRLTGGDAEVYRFFSNNKWFLEATAEYAGRFIGTSVGVGAPIHKSIDASKAYYALNGFHDYGISSFLDYIITSRQTNEGSRKEGFREMWNYVTENYSVISDINSSLESYVKDKLSASTQSLYEDFWRDVFTRSYMPGADITAGGVMDINAINRAKITSSMEIKKNGVGVFRYNFTPRFMFKDDTALTRSFFFEASPITMTGDVYRLSGLDMTDRVPGEPPYEGAVNISNNADKDVLVPYTAGDSFGLIAVFKSSPAQNADIQVTVSSTSVKWDNQREIQEKVGNTTLRSSDKLRFTPVLPNQKEGDLPFTAVVTLNDSEDYKTEVDRVENGTPFEVNPPMKDVPPEKVTVNIKIFRDGKLVHEYQSAEMMMDAKVTILGPRDVVYDLAEGETQVEHSFKAMAAPTGEYRFVWNFGDGSSSDSTTGGDESGVSHTYAGPKEYKPTVTLYDLKGNILSTDSVSLTLKKEEPGQPETKEDPAVSVPPPASAPAPKYAWFFTGTRVNDWKTRLDTNNAATFSWKTDISASGNSVEFKNTYIGNRTDSWMRNGMSESGTVTWSTPPGTSILPDDIVSVKLTAVNAPRDHANFDGIASIKVGLQRLDKDGKISGNLSDWQDAAGTYLVGYASGRGPVTQDLVSATMCGKIGVGSYGGQKISILVRASGQGNSVDTEYIYEWRPE